MKKFWIIILIIILVNIVVAMSNILILAIKQGENFTMWNIEKIERSSKNIRKDASFEITNIDNLNINIKSSDVRLILTNDEKIRVVQYSNKEIDESKLVSISKNNAEIEINEQKSNMWFCLNIFNINYMAYDIYIPQSYKNNLGLVSASGTINFEDEIELKNIKISLASGDINMSKKVKAENIEIKTASGDMEFKEIVAKKVNLESASGNITLKDNIEVEKIKLKSISGEIETKNMKLTSAEIDTISGDIEIGSIAGDINIKSTSGDIKIESLFGNISLKTTSGDILINDFTILDESTISSTSGDINIYLNKESNCNINTKTTSGNIKLPNGKNFIGNEPYNTLKLETISGDINLK